MARPSRREQRYYRIADVGLSDGPDLTRMRILAVPYGTWTDVGWFHERFAAGSLDKSIREAASDLPLLLFHDADEFPIGRAVKWVLDDPAGLVGEWEIDKGDAMAQEAARKAAGGFLTGASIGFQPIRSKRVFPDDPEWDSSVPSDGSEMQVTRLEARLLEVSLTPTPMYADAVVQLVRSQEARDPSRPRAGMSAHTRRLMGELARLTGRGA